MKQCLERLYNGIIKENPTFVLMLGMCPTLAVTTSAINGLGMGLSTMVVLALSNLMISALRKIIPDKVRIPAYIVIIATFVTLVELLLHAYVPVLHESLGIYISLIVVNCIILGRAESYASKNKMMPSLFDGIGMGLGFTIALTIIGLVREFLGAGTVFGFSGPDLYGAPLPELLIGLINRWLDPNSLSESVRFWNRVLTDEIASFGPMSIMIMAPGAFFILAILTSVQNVVKEKGKKNGKDVSKIQSGCNSDCMNCKDSGCSKSLTETEEKESLQPVAAEPEDTVKVSGSKDAADKEAKEHCDNEAIEQCDNEAGEHCDNEEKEVNVEVKEPADTDGDNEAIATDADAEITVHIDNAGKKENTTKEEQTGKKDKAEGTDKKKHKKTLLEVTQEIDIVELEELLGEEEEGNADE